MLQALMGVCYHQKAMRLLLGGIGVSSEKGEEAAQLPALKTTQNSQKGDCH